MADTKASHVGVLEVDQATSLPNLDSSRGGFGFEGTTPKYWNGSAWATFTGGASVSTWDELYDLDKTLTVDDTTFTIALTHATNDGLTVSATGSTGDAIQISNAGTGKDINGTSSTWSLSKTGDLLVKTIAHPTTDTDLTINANGTGKVTIAGTSTGNIELQRATVVASGKAVTITGTGGSDMLTISAGDVVLGDGSLTITDADNASTVAVTNNTLTSATLVDLVSTSLTTGKGVAITANALSNGALYYGESSAAGWGTGFFIQMNDGSNRFTVGADGATIINSGVNSTVALKVVGIQTAEDMVEFTSSGVTASGQGVLLINSSGNSADGSAQVRIAPSGTPVEGAVAVQVVAGSKVMKGLDIDTDAATNSGNLINGGGAIATNKAVLELTADGTPANTASSVFRVAFTGTATNKPRVATFIGTGKDAGGIYVDTDNTTTHALSVTGTGVLNAGRMLFVDNDSTPAAATDAVAEVTFTGTATNNPIVLSVNNSTKDAAPLVVNSNVAAATRSVGTFVQDSTTGAQEVLTLQQDDVDQPFVELVTTIGTGNAIEAVAAKTLTTTHFVMVKIPGGLTRYYPIGTIA